VYKFYGLDATFRYLMSQTSFIQVEYPQPHPLRTRQILAAHPEVKSLFGNTPSTAFWVAALVALQLAIAARIGELPIWVNLLVAYCVGAIATHGLWALVHDTTHNLAFKSSTANKALQIFANLPMVAPLTMSFRIYHLQHHRYQGEYDKDADLVSPFEYKMSGRSAIGKALWLLLFPLMQSFRVTRLKKISFLDRWVLVNYAVQIPFAVAFGLWAGWEAMVYLGVSSFFSVGLHPVGARWIQEHYVVKPGQETYSYYGPMNRIQFNIGYHNEHHDLVMVPWSKLPKLKAMAPEFYDSLHAHASWTRLLLKFVFDRDLTLMSRITRESHASTVASESPAQPGLTTTAAPASPANATTPAI
jgi:sphingolipid delta-4 desaturase